MTPQTPPKSGEDERVGGGGGGGGPEDGDEGRLIHEREGRLRFDGERGKPPSLSPYRDRPTAAGDG